MKKIMLIVLAVVLIAGGVVAFLLLGNKDEASGNDENKQSEEAWNPYASDERFMVTLKDFLISAANRYHIVKMTVTLEFSDQDAFEKFKGSSKPGQASSGGGHGEEEGPAFTPMEIAINSLIAESMLKTNEETLDDLTKLEQELTQYLNDHLESEEPLIKRVYIENYVVQ